LLPVWHKVDKERLLAYSPMLADRLAANTNSGIDSVADDVSHVVLDPTNPTIPAERRGLAARFVQLLNSGPPRMRLIELMQSHRSLTCAAFQVPAWNDTDLHWSVQLGPHHVDLAIGCFEATPMTWSWTIVDFLEPSASPTTTGKTELDDVVAKLADVHKWILRHSREAGRVLRGIGTRGLGGRGIAGWLIRGSIKKTVVISRPRKLAPADIRNRQ